MGTVAVVVVDVVGDESFELLVVPDDGAVEELTTETADPAFRERVGAWCPDRCLEDLHVFGADDFVEGVDELATSVAYERPCVGELVAVSDEEVAGGLGRPGSGGVLGDAAEVDGSGGDVDEEQQVEPAERDGVDGGEVAGDCGLGAQELFRSRRIAAVLGRCWRG